MVEILQRIDAELCDQNNAKGNHPSKLSLTGPVSFKAYRGKAGSYLGTVDGPDGLFDSSSLLVLSASVIFVDEMVSPPPPSSSSLLPNRAFSSSEIS